LLQKRPWKTQYKAGFLPEQAVLGRAGVQNYAAAINTSGRASMVRRLLSGSMLRGKHSALRHCRYTAQALDERQLIREITALQPRVNGNVV